MFDITKSYKFLAGTALAAVMLVSSTSRADAALIAYICDDAACLGGNDVIVTDQGAGDNFPGSAIVGQINAGALNFGGFSIVTNVSQSKPLIGSASVPQLDLTFSAVTNDSALHTIYLYASDTDFTGRGPFGLTLGGTQTPSGDSNTIVGRAYGGNSNTNLDLTNLLVTTGPSGATPFGLSANGSTAGAANPFGLTIGVQITRGSAGTTTGDLNLSTASAPEPAAMMLLGSGLLGIGFVRRRRIFK